MKLSKLKPIFTNKYFILVMIMLLALFARLLNIDKPCGLWYDEMLAYIYASQKSLLDIIRILWHEDFHMPLYFIYLHLWINAFDSSDIVLRLASVFWGVLTIPAFYFLGKIYKSEKLGYILAVIGCLSPIMIYYSQEVRFYSMLMFFSTLSVIFFLKLLEEPSKIKFILFGSSNLIILYTYTMGIVFVGIEMVILLFHFYVYKKEYLNNLIKYFSVFFILTIPFFILLYNYIKGANNAFISPFADFGIFNYKDLIVLINDWFSPFMVGLRKIDLGTYKNLLTNSNAVVFFLFMSLSSICFIIGLLFSIVKNDKTKTYLFILGVNFLLAELFLCLHGDLYLTSRYTLIILPVIFLICLDGLLSIKTQFLRNFCLGIIIVVFSFNLLNFSNMISHSQRESKKSYLEWLGMLKPDKKDYFLFLTDNRLYSKYMNISSSIKLDIRGILFQDKTKREALKIFDKQFVATTNQYNSMDKFVPFLLNDEPTNELKNFLNMCIKSIPSGNKLILVMDFVNSNCSNKTKEFIRAYQIYPTKKNKLIYKNNIYSMLECKIFNDTKKVLNTNKYLKIVKLKTFNYDSKLNVYSEIIVYKKL